MRGTWHGRGFRRYASPMAARPHGSISEHPTSLPAPAYRFDRYEVRPAERLLLADGAPVKLGGRALDMLVALLERHERVVGKRELMDIVWPNLVVEENNLQVQVMTLRKALGPAAIATVPGRGYRLTLPVEMIGSAPADPEVPPAASTSAVPRRTNVPANLPPMYGRADDLAAMRTLVRENALVSIVGAGGIGKTRVAQALASELAGEFADGAWMVALASLADADLVASAVARVVGITLPSDRAGVDVVTSVLRTQRMLLVLDDCERLLEGVVTLVEALRQAAPEVRLLVTSQETLKSLDEHVYRLGTLVVPTTQIEDAGSCQRGRDVRVGSAGSRSALRADDAQYERGGGHLPKARRHPARAPARRRARAAAWHRRPSRAPGRALSRADRRRAHRVAPAPDIARRARVEPQPAHGRGAGCVPAAFRVRWRIHAGGGAEGGTDATVSEWHVLEHLGALVDKSLVVAEGEDIPRYRLLETTRAFALERLGDAGETDEYLRRHAIATRDVIMALMASSWRRTEAESAAFAAELDNARTAVAWVCTVPEERLLAIELHTAAARVWHGCALFAESLAHCMEARRFVDATIPPLALAKFWLALATPGMYSPRPVCLEAAQKAARIFRDLDEPGLAYDALTKVAAIGARRGALAEVAAALDEAEQIEEPGWPARQRAQLSLARCMWCTMDGRYPAALEFARQQRDLYRQQGAVIGEQVAAGNIGAALAALDQPEAALAEVRPAIARLEELNADTVAGHIIGVETIALVMLGRHDEALKRARVAYSRLQRRATRVAARTLRGALPCRAIMPTRHGSPDSSTGVFRPRAKCATAPRAPVAPRSTRSSRKGSGTTRGGRCWRTAPR